MIWQLNLTICIVNLWLVYNLLILKIRALKDASEFTPLMKENFFNK